MTRNLRQLRRMARLILFERHAPWARSIARAAAKRLPSCFAVEDLEQVAGAELWKQTGLYDPSRAVPFQGFALMAIRGACYMSVRRREYTEAMHEELAEGTPAPVEQGPERQAELAEFQRRVRVTLESLAPDERQVLELHYLDGESLSECAKRIGKSISEIYALKAQALAAAQRRLSDYAG